MTEALDGDPFPSRKILDLRTDVGVDVTDSVGTAVPDGVVGRDDGVTRVEVKERSRACLFAVNSVGTSGRIPEIGTEAVVLSTSLVGSLEESAVSFPVGSEAATTTDSAERRESTLVAGTVVSTIH